jgi:hypothetical protein
VKILNRCKHGRQSYLNQIQITNLSISSTSLIAVKNVDHWSISYPLSHFFDDVYDFYSGMLHLDLFFNFAIYSVRRSVQPFPTSPEYLPLLLHSGTAKQTPPTLSAWEVNQAVSWLCHDQNPELYP